eukprot:7366241-Alexandrium_andersonii.AAC.1
MNIQLQHASLGIQKSPTPIHPPPTSPKQVLQLVVFGGGSLFGICWNTSLRKVSEGWSKGLLGMSKSCLGREPLQGEGEGAAPHPLLP